MTKVNSPLGALIGGAIASALLDSDFLKKVKPPELTDELRAQGFITPPESGWPDHDPDTFAEVFADNGARGISRLGSLQLPLVAFYRPIAHFGDQNWNRYEGGWPDVTPDTEIEASCECHEDIVRRKAIDLPWGVAGPEGHGIRFWRIAPPLPVTADTAEPAQTEDDAAKTPADEAATVEA